MRTESSKLLGRIAGCLCAAAALLLGPGHGLVTAAKEGLAETVIRAVEHREQLIKSIHSMKAIWRVEFVSPREPPQSRRNQQREMFLFEGDKQRTESVFRSPGQGRQVAGSAQQPGGLRMLTVEQHGESRTIIVSHGQVAYLLIETGAGTKVGPRRVRPDPREMCPATAHWAGIEWRFGFPAYSSRMRGGEVALERAPGQRERYRVTVRDAARRETCTWWVAPEYGYAVIRRQVDVDNSPPGALIYRYERFKQLSPGVWLPHRSEMRTYGRDASGAWKLDFDRSAAAQVMKLNIDIPDHYFQPPKAK